MPPMVVSFMSPESVLIINDPVILGELYVTNNKYFDKGKKQQEMYSSFIG